MHLKEGSLWRNILAILRDELYLLRWVSLRRIDHVQSVQTPSEEAGTEISDHPYSDIESTSDEEHGRTTLATDHALCNAPGSDGDDDQGDIDDIYEDFDEEHWLRSNVMDFPNLGSPKAHSAVPWCTCESTYRLGTAKNLADDGLQVDNAKRKYWARWVVRRCPFHG